MPQSNSDWTGSVLFPLLRYPDDQSILQSLDKPVTLLSADVDRVQDYVFESTRLPEIRGASMLVDEINRREPSTWRPPVKTVGDLFQAEGLPPEAIIYSGGGSLLALLPDLPTAERIKSGIERLLPGLRLRSVRCLGLAPASPFGLE
jgi:CRISPR-associated protein Cmr2